MTQRIFGKKVLILITVISLLFSLLLMEIALRLVGFRYRLYPEKIEFGWPNPSLMASLYQADDDLLWVQKNYQEKVAKYSATTPTVVLMGDSCTEFGQYDLPLQELLQQNKLPNTISVANLGVGGWSSYQGLQQMKRDIPRLKPKIATIYFGWNDHWMGFGIQDKHTARIRSPLYSTLERLRLAQLATKAYIAWGQEEYNKHPYRVSLVDFRSNLLNIAQVAQANDIIPVLLTAPSSHRVGKEPEYLKQRWLKDLKQLVPLHLRYVEVVREVAKDKQIPLCDLYDKFSKLPAEDLANIYFYKDGIHLTHETKSGKEGNKKLAEYLNECLQPLINTSN